MSAVGAVGAAAAGLMTMPELAAAFSVLGAAFAAAAGFCGWNLHVARSRMREARKRITGERDSRASSAKAGGCGHAVEPVGMSRHGRADECKKRRDAIIERLKRISLLLKNDRTRQLCPSPLRHSLWFEKVVAGAGLADSVTEAAFCETRFRMCALLAVVGALMGCVFSGMFAVVLGIVGAILGWRAPKDAVKRFKDRRTQEMESRLPEMLGVLALGMRSGLSFDAALRLYCAHMDCELARELEVAQKLWMSGLEERDRALRRLASSYGSPVFDRVTETWVRSLRFGTSMVEGLECEGRQARAAYRSKREEQISKAPVKMMVPTGTLILPAMLVLVLGPVLLELMNGGV